MSWASREVIRDMDWSELEAAFWEKHAAKLTPAERERIVSGDYAALTRPVPPEWTPGEWVAVASNLWIRPEAAVWRRKGYRVAFDVRDFRTRLVRRVPQVMDAPEVDEYGRPMQPTPVSIAEARLDGSYTSAHTLAVQEDDEAVGDDALNVYAAEAHAKQALGDSERTQERLAEIKQLPASRRMVELHKLASERGVDVRDDVRAFERRVKRRLGRAA